jgi:hypothetical protein
MSRQSLHVIADSFSAPLCEEMYRSQQRELREAMEPAETAPIAGSRIRMDWLPAYEVRRRAEKDGQS